MTGFVLPEWQEWWDSLSKKRPEVLLHEADEWWAERRERILGICVNAEETDALIALLRKVLVADPAARPTAAEVAQDPWFLTDYDVTPGVITV